MNKTAMQAIAIAMVMAMAATSLVAVMSSDVSAEQSYDVDMGKKYSMQTQLIWDGKDAESIHYEIVDSTGAHVTSSDEWNPLITWPAPGVYYITQTAHNSYNGAEARCRTSSRPRTTWSLHSPRTPRGTATPSQDGLLTRIVRRHSTGLRG